MKLEVGVVDGNVVARASVRKDGGEEAYLEIKIEEKKELETEQEKAKATPRSLKYRVYVKIGGEEAEYSLYVNRDGLYMEQPLWRMQKRRLRSLGPWAMRLK